MHWLSRRLALQSEVVCDARVIRSGFRKDHYAHILCDLASHAPYSAVAMASPSGLEWRVRHLGRATFPLTRWWFAVLVLALVVCAICLSVLRPARDPGTPSPPRPRTPLSDSKRIHFRWIKHLSSSAYSPIL